MEIKIPVYKLSKNERIWLTTAYECLKEDKSTDFREIWGKINGKIKSDFKPLAMNTRIINGNGEQPKLLGLVALDKGYKILRLCNKVIKSVKYLIDQNPLIENIKTQEVSDNSGVGIFETGMILNLIKEYGNFWSTASFNKNNFTVISIHIVGDENIFYQYKQFRSIQASISDTLKKEANDKLILAEWAKKQKGKDLFRETQFGDEIDQVIEVDNSIKIFIHPDRIAEIKNISSEKFDFIKLLKLCEELNNNYSNGNYMAVGMIGRTILDHVPPIFECKNFESIANNYGDAQKGKSFKRNMLHLNGSLKNIADSYLHQQIREKEILPNETQVDFRQDLDVLLGEIVRISKK